MLWYVRLFKQDKCIVHNTMAQTISLIEFNKRKRLITTGLRALPQYRTSLPLIYLCLGLLWYSVRYISGSQWLSLNWIRPACWQDRFLHSLRSVEMTRRMISRNDRRNDQSKWQEDDQAEWQEGWSVEMTGGTLCRNDRQEGNARKHLLQTAAG